MWIIQIKKQNESETGQVRIGLPHRGLLTDTWPVLLYWLLKYKQI